MSVDEDFSAFVSAQSSTLFTTAYLLTGNALEAEELLQDVLVRLYPKWARVSAADAPVAYVRRSVVNQFVGARRSARNAEPTLSAIPESGSEDEALVAVLDRAVIAELLEALTARQRAAIVLRFFHDQLDDEIATALGCRAATVRSLISRGLAAMRAQLLRPAGAPADGTEARS